MRTMDIGYRQFAEDIAQLLVQARRQAARSVNAVLTATYWEIGRRIVEFEQGGQKRAGYGESLLQRLSADLIHRFGRGFSVDHLELMRKFYLSWPPPHISESPVRKSKVGEKSESMIRKLPGPEHPGTFPLSWTHYVHLVRLDDKDAQIFYEKETLRGGWSARQLERQIGDERHLLEKTSKLEEGSFPSWQVEDPK